MTFPNNTTGSILISLGWPHISEELRPMYPTNGSQPTGVGGRQSGGQGGRLITSSGPAAGFWWTWRGSAERRPASTSQPMALG